MAEYADVIIDIVHKAVDRTFQYRIPEALRESLMAGTCVRVPFGKGNTLRDGYVIGFSDTPEFDPEKIKEIDSVWEENLPIVRHGKCGDIIAVIGKGHETYQETKGVRIHFSDREELERAVNLYR